VAKRLHALFDVDDRLGDRGDELATAADDGRSLPRRADTDGKRPGHLVACTDGDRDRRG